MKKKHSLLFCALFTIFTGHAESTDYITPKDFLSGLILPIHCKEKKSGTVPNRMPVGNHSHCPSAMEASVLIFWVMYKQNALLLMRKHSGVAALIQPKEQITIGM